MSDFGREQSARSMDLIDGFVNRTGLLKRTIPVLGKTILLLGPDSAPPIDPGRLEGYTLSHLDALDLKHGISNNCFAIAEATQNINRATGIMHANRGTQEFVGWDNHWINFDVFEDGTAAAIDLTASHNIDWKQGRFDILALRVPNQEELTLRVGELFGGQWQIDE